MIETANVRKNLQRNTSIPLISKMQQMRAWHLVRVQQFELLGALVEVVTQGEAVAPALK